MNTSCALILANDCTCTGNGGRYDEKLSFCDCSAVSAVFKAREGVSINIQSAVVDSLRFLRIERATQ